MASLLFFRAPIAALSTLDEKHHFAGQSKDFTTLVPRISPSRPSRLKVRAEKFNLWEILGGRGLAGGEEGLIKELKKQTDLPNSSGQPLNFAENEPNVTAGMVSANAIDDDKAFDKELQGLTGGFPGGEKGLKKFLTENPPPPKGVNVEGSSELGSLSFSKPKTPPLPLLMPGMIVIVKNPENPYHMFCGIVQRVTDGKVGVLFEGGNWDKLVTFKLQDLERRSQGPPMSNPKSAILENMKLP